MIALFYVIQYLNPEPHLNQTGNTMGDKILHTTDAEFDTDVLGATTLSWWISGLNGAAPAR